MYVRLREKEKEGEKEKEKVGEKEGEKGKVRKRAFLMGPSMLSPWLLSPLRADRSLKTCCK